MPHIHPIAKATKRHVLRIILKPITNSSINSLEAYRGYAAPASLCSYMCSPKFGAGRPKFIADSAGTQYENGLWIWPIKRLAPSSSSSSSSLAAIFITSFRIETHARPFSLTNQLKLGPSHRTEPKTRRSETHPSQLAPQTGHKGPRHFHQSKPKCGLSPTVQFQQRTEERESEREGESPGPLNWNQ